MLLSDFITVYNATTNVEKHDRPKTDNLSLGDKTVSGDVVCKAYKYYENNIPICNIYRLIDGEFKQL